MDQLPIDVLHWVAALVPIVALLILLAGLRWKAPEAGPIGMFLAAIIGLLLFDASFEVLAVAAGKGLWDAVFILFVVWPALLLYLVADRAGAFEALRAGIRHFSENELFLVMAFGWVFASFLQGIAGFGVPIAVVAPLLVGLGVRPLYAVAIPLIGHAWANMFGTLAVGWLATTRVIDIEEPVVTAFTTAILLWIPNLMAGFAIAWIFGRMAAVKHAVPMILIISAIHGGGQLFLVLWSPVLSTFIAATVALLALYPLSRWARYREHVEEIEERPAMASDRAKDVDEKPVMGLRMAILPYIILIVLTVVVLVPPPIEEALGQFEVGPSFPAVEAGFGTQVEAEEPYSPFAPLTHPGILLLVAAALAWVVYRSRGYYAAWREGRGSDQEGILPGLVSNALPASIAVSSFLIMSQVMSDSAQTDVLALGIAEVAPPVVFAFVSSLIGIVGAFMTSSNTASNILFAPLQQDAAAALGLNEPAIIGAQSTGGAIGNAIAPANVVLGTGTAGNVGKEGDVLRLTLPWAAAAAVLVGIVTVVLSGLEVTL